MTNPRKILIVSKGFHPENSPRAHRATELAIEFSREGHEVTVLVPNRHSAHAAFEREHGVRVNDLGRTHWRTPNFGRSKLGYQLTRACVRLLSLGFEYPDIELMFKVKRALRAENGYDLLISIAVPYPIHWGVAWARKPEWRIAGTWVADCGDPYAGLRSDTFPKPFYFRYVEAWFVRRADYVAVPVASARQAYLEATRPKLRVIPQGLSFPVVENSLAGKTNAVATFAYVGSIISYRHHAVPFLRMLDDVDDPFEFEVYTTEADFYKSTMSPETLQKTHLHQYVPREELHRRLASVDFLIHFPYAHDSQKSFKLIDYHYTGKPILSFTDDLASRTAFRAFLRGDYSMRMPREDVDAYRVENVCRQFLDLLPDC
jgi:hypothetical protein